jgi:hypothetical protein
MRITFLATIDLRRLSDGTCVCADTAASDTKRAQHVTADRKNTLTLQPLKPLPDMIAPSACCHLTTEN